MRVSAGGLATGIFTSSCDGKEYVTTAVPEKIDKDVRTAFAVYYRKINEDDEKTSSPRSCGGFCLTADALRRVSGRMAPHPETIFGIMPLADVELPNDCSAHHYLVGRAIPVPNHEHLGGGTDSQKSPRLAHPCCQ